RKASPLALAALPARPPAGRAAVDGGVVCVDRDRAAVDLSEPGHHSVTRDSPVLHSEALRAVRCENVELYKRPLVEEHLDALARRRLAHRPALVLSGRVRMQRLVAPLAVLVDLLLGYRRGDAFGRLDAVHRGRRASYGRHAFWSAGGH